MNNPVPSLSTRAGRTAPDSAPRAPYRAAANAPAFDYPTPRGIGSEIGGVLAVTLGIAFAVCLILSACGIE
jgi:hypothetical protein